jgi:hypothetical protein
LIHRSPEVVAFATDREEDCIEMPLVTRLRASASELMGIVLAECPAPLADGLIGILATGDRKPPLSAHDLCFPWVPDWL